ncbi:MAG: hypothetical protein K9G48_14970, partial [Reyranella sp.]|nr:hypothetical protein [Reyranella sp.]
KLGPIHQLQASSSEVPHVVDPGRHFFRSVLVAYKHAPERQPRLAVPCPRPYLKIQPRVPIGLRHVADGRRQAKTDDMVNRGQTQLSHVGEPFEYRPYGTAGALGDSRCRRNLEILANEIEIGLDDGLPGTLATLEPPIDRGGIADRSNSRAGITA